ncbi:MAG: glycosyltransferase family 2 protein [Verrucomicrobiae bacterium]|nr:glycosyltransferase family 2 protein [Verrucomicrobiae bacterium]
MTANGVCAVVITYNPDGGFLARARAIAQQVDDLVVVDNYSYSQPELRRECEVAGFGFIANPQNLGVGVALNQAVQWAQRRGFPWALFFDQDSLPKPDCAAELLAIAHAAGHVRPVGLVGANYWDGSRGQYLVEPSSAQRWIETASVITSGSLLSIAAYKVAGPFREDFFIDSIDIEYALRLRAHGFAVLLSSKPLMNHAIGAPSRHRFLWKYVVCSNHSPMRRYYITRNRLIVVRSYFRREPLWALKHLRGLVNHCVLTVLYEKERARKFRAIALGLCHGLRGVSGKLDRLL